MAAIDNPSGKKRQYREQSRTGQCGQPPEQAEDNPIPKLVFVFQIQRDQKEQTKQQRRQPCFPDALNRKINRIGTECPRPTGPFRNPLSKTDASDQENQHADQRRHQGIQRKQNNGRGLSVDAEYLEHPRNQIGINRRHPRGRPRVLKQRTAEAATLRNGAGDSASFISEMPVIALRFELLGQQKHHDNQPNYQRHQDHGNEKWWEASWARRLVRYCGSQVRIGRRQQALMFRLGSIIKHRTSLLWIRMIARAWLLPVLSP